MCQHNYGKKMKIDYPFADATLEEIEEAHMYINASLVKKLNIEPNGLSKELKDYIALWLATHITDNLENKEVYKNEINKCFILATDLGIQHGICYYLGQLAKLKNQSQLLDSEAFVFFDVIDKAVKQNQKYSQVLHAYENLEEEFWRVHRKNRLNKIELGENFFDAYNKMKMIFLTFKLETDLSNSTEKKSKMKI